MNMSRMVVTLEVSRLSGWLNVDAPCRESKEGHAMRGEVQTGRPEVAADRGARKAQRRWLQCRLGAGHGEERTQNMLFMSVTLEVLKLRGWLNPHRLNDPFGSCRGSKEGRAMGGEVQTERPEVAGGHGARGVQERARLQIWGKARRGAHVEHVSHVCDAGGVEAQRLVERRRALPRVEGRACDAGRGADRQAGGGGRPRCTQRAAEGSTADWEQGTGRSAPRTWSASP